jgi:hypothetical protein
MKQKLLLALLALFTLGGSNLYAQTWTEWTNVTDKITNPSFELDEAIVDLTSCGWATDRATGWTIAPSSPSNSQVGVGNSSSTIQGIATSFTPSAGEKYFYMRENWNPNTEFSVAQTISNNIPAGFYKLTVKVAMFSSVASTYTLSLQEGDLAAATNSYSYKGTANGESWKEWSVVLVKQSDDTPLTIKAAYKTPSENSGSKHYAMLLDDFQLQYVAPASVSSTNPLDITSWMINPSFELGTYNGTKDPASSIEQNAGGHKYPTGWTFLFKSTGWSNCAAITENPADGAYAHETWAGGPIEFKVYQTIKDLPRGVYEISASARTENAGNNDICTYGAFNGVTTYSEPFDVNNITDPWTSVDNWQTLTARFTMREAGSPEVGIHSTKFMQFDNFKLYYLGTDLITDIPVESISLNESSVNLTIGGNYNLQVTYTPEDANTGIDITWSTSDETVATIADGVVTAVGPGTATITATTANDKAATCTITVSDVTPATPPANYSDIAAGDFYIVNAATGKYLGGANDYGTHASLIKHGILFSISGDDGVYTFDSHTYNNENQHFLTGTYVDGNSTNFYIVSLGSGKYSISTADGSAYLTAKSTDANNTIVDNSAPNANSVLAQWYFVSKADRDQLLNAATDDNPADATYYLTEANISRNLRKAYNTKAWSGDYAYGGKEENQCAERYCANTNVYQTISVPNGKYTVTCQGFYRRQSGEATSYLYANDEQVALNQIEFGGINSMTGASEAFTNGEYNNTLTVYVTDGTLKVGIKCDAATNWTIWDNFEIYYHGPSIGGEAVKLADPMEAGKWYYFDLDFDGTYKLTANTLSDIVYTNDGTVLIENEGTVTTQFAGAENQQLTAGRYYVKSSSEQTFTIAPASYDYSLGEVVLSTADGGYTQNSTFTVTFPNAVTNDPEGALALVENSKATVNGAEVALTTAENGFTFELGTFAANTDFVITIPAAVYGYADHIMNEAINITIHTPAVFDGEYVLYDATNKLFLGRGAAYGTEATPDKYGIPFTLATDATGVSSFKFVDNDQYLFSNNSGVAAGMYTDDASTGWNIIAATDGYILKDANGDVYAKVDNGSLGLYAHTVEGSENATVWTFKTKAERDAIIAAYPTDNINNVINASGVSTTADAFAAYLSENYNAVDCTSSIGTATFESAVGDWTWSSYYRNQDGQPAYGTGFVEAWNATGAWTQTISKDNLPAGIYKVTVQGYERRKANDAATALYNTGYKLVSTFLSANDEQVRFTDWNDVEGKPTNTAGAVTAFTNGEAINEVYVYLDGNANLTLTVKKPNYIWDCWVIWNNVTLTRYEKIENVIINETESYDPTMYADKHANVTFKRTLVEGWNGLVLPFDLTVEDAKTKFNATAVKDFESISYDAEKGATLNFTNATEIKAGKPFMIKAAAGTEYTFDGVLLKSDALQTISQESGNAKYIMTGTYQKVDLTNVNFVLIQGDKYYQHNTNKASSAKAFRAYFANESTGDAATKGINFNFDGEATGITLVEDAQNSMNGDIYNLQGQKVNHAQKGVYIVNGKKIVVK